MGKKTKTPPPAPPIAEERYWNLEDRGATRRQICGVFLLAFGGACFVSATIAAWSFISGSDTSDTLKYYYLLVPVTLPATIIFVYLNWLSVSFFKTA